MNSSPAALSAGDAAREEKTMDTVAQIRRLYRSRTNRKLASKSPWA
jgi:hypothetical protein